MTLDKALECCRACGTDLAEHKGAWDPYEWGHPKLDNYDPRNEWESAGLLPFVVFYCPRGCDDDEELRRLLSGNMYTVPTQVQVRTVDLQGGHGWERRLDTRATTNHKRKRARK
jgi:hypothetical protein